MILEKTALIRDKINLGIARGRTPGAERLLKPVIPKEAARRKRSCCGPERVRRRMEESRRTKKPAAVGARGIPVSESTSNPGRPNETESRSAEREGLMSRVRGMREGERRRAEAVRVDNKASAI